MGSEHVLVTTMGTGDYEETTYILEGEGEASTHLSSLALAKMLDVGSIFAARTVEAGEKYDEDLRKLEDHEINVKVQEIPWVENLEDANEIIECFTEEFAERDIRISLDITHGFRSLPILFFAVVSYLDALDHITVEGIYYGQFNSEAGQSKLIDLTFLNTLLDWYYSLRVFDRTGSLRPLAELLGEKRDRLYAQNQKPRKFSKFVEPIQASKRGIDAGLPLESGIELRKALAAIDDLDEDRFVGPEGAVFDPLRDQLEPFALQQDRPSKATIQLDMAELHREAGFVRFYSEKGRYWLALECAHELFINRVLLNAKAFEREEWLDVDRRQKTKKRIEKKNRRADSTSDALELWGQLSELRDYYAGAGFEADGTRTDPQKVNNTIDSLCSNLDNNAYWEGLP